MISIAIDGPSGAGKSSLSRRLAAELGYIYVDTGAMYRTIGLHVLRSGADTEDEDAVAALLPGIRLEMRYVDGVQHMFLNGEDVSGLIRTEEVSMAASHVSAHPSVRAFLLDAQRALAKDNNVLMDGRDIGTVVLPGAQVKIFLTASAGDRARRRYDELIARGEWVSYEQVLADVERRDYNDTHRAAAPLRPAADAVTVDTTGFTFDDAFALLLSTIRARLGQEGERCGFTGSSCRWRGWCGTSRSGSGSSEGRTSSMTGASSSRPTTSPPSTLYSSLLPGFGAGPWSSWPKKSCSRSAAC